jgi:hypothetical protein
VFGTKKIKMVCCVCETSLKLDEDSAMATCHNLPLMTEGFLAGLQTGNFPATKKASDLELTIDAFWGMAIVWATHNLFLDRIDVQATFTKGTHLPRSRNTEFDSDGNSEHLMPLEPEVWESLSVSNGTKISRNDAEFLSAIAFFRVMSATTAWDGWGSKCSFYIISEVLSSDHWELSGNTLTNLIELVESRKHLGAVPQTLWDSLVEKCRDGEVFRLADQTSWHEVKFTLSCEFKENDEYSEERLDGEMAARSENEMYWYRPALKTDQHSASPFRKLEGESWLDWFEMDWDDSSEEALEGEDIPVEVHEAITVQGMTQVRAASAAEAQKVFLKLSKTHLIIEQIDFEEPEERELDEATLLEVKLGWE